MAANKDFIHRFLNYVQIDTQSDEDATDQPTTAKQRALAELLEKELKSLGARITTGNIATFMQLLLRMGVVLNPCRHWDSLLISIRRRR